MQREESRAVLAAEGRAELVAGRARRADLVAPEEGVAVVVLAALLLAAHELLGIERAEARAVVAALAARTGQGRARGQLALDPGQGGRVDRAVARRRRVAARAGGTDPL